MLSREWRCIWSNADRRSSNYIWVINNFIAYYGSYYIRCLRVIGMASSSWQHRLIRERYDNRDYRGIQFKVIQPYIWNCQVRPHSILVIQCILKEWDKNIYPQIPKHMIDCIMDSNSAYVWVVISCNPDSNTFAAFWSIPFRWWAIWYYGVTVLSLSDATMCSVIWNIQRQNVALPVWVQQITYRWHNLYRTIYVDESDEISQYLENLWQFMYSQNNYNIVLSVNTKMPWWDGKSNLAYIMLFMNTAFA